MKTLRHWSILIVSFLSIAACGGVGKSAQGVASTALANLGCKTSQSEMWNQLNKIAEDGETYPSAAELRQALLTSGAAQGQTSAAFQRYVEAFVANYSLTIDGIREKFGPYNEATWKKALAEMEVGVHVTEVHAELADKIESSLATLADAEKDLGQSCNQPEPVPPAPVVPDSGDTTRASYATVWEQLKAGGHPEVYGARLALATAYQSCDALKLPPMTSDLPDIQGIGVDARANPINGGKLRHYASVSQIDASHYYVHGSTLAKNTCSEVRNRPPIYDFGGKPYASSAKLKYLDLFRGDGGTGSEVFGMDCSGYIFTSLAAGGMRIINPSATPLKSTMVAAVSAAAFKEPQSNGLKCLEKIKVDASHFIEPGDVAAISGHVIMVDSVGADPFGLARITSSAGCATLSYSSFDFVIAQSAPVQNGTGINRYVAKDYLRNESTTFRNGFVRYAQAACRAKFGLAPALSSPDMSVVRAKKTPECIEAQPMELSKQDCVDSCHPL